MTFLRAPKGFSLLSYLLHGVTFISFCVHSKGPPTIPSHSPLSSWRTEALPYNFWISQHLAVTSVAGD